MPFSKTIAPTPAGKPVLPISVATPVLVFIEYKMTGEPFVKYSVSEPVENPITVFSLRPVGPISVVAPVVVFTE